jgi:L-asparaginase
VIQGRYSTSRHLAEAGVISGRDITPEAALSKMQFLFSKYRNKGQIRSSLATPLRGEMSH